MALMQSEVEVRQQMSAQVWSISLTFQPACSASARMKLVAPEMSRVVEVCSACCHSGPAAAAVAFAEEAFAVVAAAGSSAVQVGRSVAGDLEILQAAEVGSCLEADRIPYPCHSPVEVDHQNPFHIQALRLVAQESHAHRQDLESEAAVGSVVEVGQGIRIVVAVADKEVAVHGTGSVAVEEVGAVVAVEEEVRSIGRG